MATEVFRDCFKNIKNHNVNFKITNDINTYNQSIRYDIEFLIGPPPFPDKKLGSYRIIYFYWETDRLPDHWARNILNSDEIWAPCNLVKDVCLKAGYKNHIEIMPTPSIADEKVNNIKLKNSISNYFLNPEYYKFYSIFQWQPRKGYKELLSAYFDEFKNNEEVILILKINLIKGITEIDVINEIKNIKQYYNSNAKIFLITEYLSNLDIFSIHSYGDCFVLPHYGEGWGMPIHEAAIFGNPIITTKYGGITDFIDTNIYWIEHKMVSVSGMEWNNVYNSSQNWAKPNLQSLKDNFRNVFNNKIKKSNKFLNFSIQNVSSFIEDRVNEIKT